jgi:alginate O-acetyltransferase complex protein AlgI
MLFNTIDFLIFIILFLLAYFQTSGNTRLWICLISSYIFYAWSDWQFGLLIIFLTVVNFFIGIKIANTSNTQTSKNLMWLGVLFNLSLLAVFKYFNFFISSLHTFLSQIGLGTDITTLKIIAPLGISFYTFKIISYFVDIYKGKCEVEKNFLKFGIFYTFFPILLTGPIVRPNFFLPQLTDHKNPSWNQIIFGIELILWGFFKKVVIADSLATVVNIEFAEPVGYTALSLFLCIIFYSFQIYCDFSGYSDIAIGLGCLLGFDFGENFNRPYFSTSFSEFWKRWHISLSSWLRDYLYIPLGGNRHGFHNTWKNLFITMVLGGLWHGANSTFIIWGAIHGVYLIFQRIFGEIYGRLILLLKIPQFFSRIFLVILVFLLTCISWVFFRAETIEKALDIFKIIFTSGNWSFSAVSFQFQVIKGLFLIVILYTFEGISFKVSLKKIFELKPLLRLFVGAVILWSIAFLGTFSGNSFIYSQF